MSAPILKLSPSSLKSFSKCGYKYKLEKIDGLVEPGKKNYGMLQGRVIGAALAEGSIQLNQDKSIDDAMVATILAHAYMDEFAKVGIEPDLGAEIHTMLLVGPSPDVMNNIDQLSHAISESPEFEFKVPPPLKKKGKGDGGYSTDKKRLGMIVQKAFLDLLWFFSEANPFINDIRDAIVLEHETRALYEVNPQTQLTGFYDQVVTLPDSSIRVHEFKSDKTPYSQEWLQKSVQGATYSLVSGNPIRWFDVSHRQAWEISYTQEELDLLLLRYRGLERAIREQAFIPVCGLDPYTSAVLRCGFKGTCHCPYSDGKVDYAD